MGAAHEEASERTGYLDLVAGAKPIVQVRGALAIRHAPHVEFDAIPVASLIRQRKCSQLLLAGNPHLHVLSGLEGDPVTCQLNPEALAGARQITTPPDPPPSITHRT